MSWDVFFDRENLSEKDLIQGEIKSDIVNSKGRMFYFREHGTILKRLQGRSMSASKEIDLRQDIARMVALRNTYSEESIKAISSQLEITVKKNRTGQVEIDVGYYIASNFEKDNVSV